MKDNQIGAVVHNAHELRKKKLELQHQQLEDIIVEKEACSKELAHARNH
jgi:hypothetical protein